MPECSFHPGVETEMRCAECERPICPKEMVLTPVGYKCPPCARPKRGQYLYIKPKQFARACGMALVAGVGGAFALGFMGMGFLIVSFLWGMLVGEATRWGSGGHRGSILAAVAVAGVIVGTLIAGLDVVDAIAGGVGAAGVLAWGWGR